MRAMIRSNPPGSDVTRQQDFIEGMFAQQVTGPNCFQHSVGIAVL